MSRPLRRAVFTPLGGPRTPSCSLQIPGPGSYTWVEVAMQEDPGPPTEPGACLRPGCVEGDASPQDGQPLLVWQCPGVEPAAGVADGAVAAVALVVAAAVAVAADLHLLVQLRL